MPSDVEFEFVIRLSLIMGRQMGIYTARVVGGLELCVSVDNVIKRFILLIPQQRHRHNVRCAVLPVRSMSIRRHEAHFKGRGGGGEDKFNTCPKIKYRLVRSPWAIEVNGKTR